MNKTINIVTHIIQGENIDNTINDTYIYGIKKHIKNNGLSPKQSLQVVDHLIKYFQN